LVRFVRAFRSASLLTCPTDMLDNKAKKYLRSNGITPDTWILPEGTATFLQVRGCAP